MVLRLWRHLCLWLAVVLVVVPSSPAAAQSSKRIVAVGDLHGDYEAWTAIARDAGLVDARGRWAGGTTIFVQTGDITDRGPDSLKNHPCEPAGTMAASVRSGRLAVALGGCEPSTR